VTQRQFAPAAPSATAQPEAQQPVAVQEPNHALDQQQATAGGGEEEIAVEEDGEYYDEEEDDADEV